VVERPRLPVKGSATHNQARYGAMAN